MDLFKHELQVICDADTRRVIDSIKRAEDITYSPSGKRLCVCDVSGSCLFLFNIERDGGIVRLSQPARVTGPEIKGPHGVVWLDEDHIIVGNRGAGVTFHRLSGEVKGEVSSESFLSLGWRKGHLVSTPGSVYYRRIDEAQGELICCNNFSDMVSCHMVERENGKVTVSSHRVMLADGLHTPDGLCVSERDKVMFVSDHFSKRILIYPFGADKPEGPIGSIDNCGYPHGLAYHHGANALLSAGAGDRNVYVTPVGADGWAVDQSSAYFFETMTEEEFMVTHINPEDGGAKGLGFSPDESTLAVSGMARSVAFYDTRSILEGAGIEYKEKPTPAEVDLKETLARNASLADATVEYITEKYVKNLRELENKHADLVAMQSSESMRLTLPLRLFGGWIRKLRD